MQAFPDNAARREVEALAAVCPNEGCTWTGTVKEFEVWTNAKQWMNVHPLFNKYPINIGRGWCICFLYQPLRCVCVVQPVSSLKLVDNTQTSCECSEKEFICQTELTSPEQLPSCFCLRADNDQQSSQSSDCKQLANYRVSKLPKPNMYFKLLSWFVTQPAC